MAADKKSVVITGCSTGIGESLATMMAEDGWIVFAGVRKEEDARKIQAKHHNIRPVYLDVTKQDQIDKAFEEVRVAVGEQGLDALVNNAGLLHAGPTEFVPISEVQRQFDVNLFGVFRVTQAAMPLLRLGKPGRIVNVSSIAGIIGIPFGAAYSGTKAALDTFSECFRREVARWGIKVSTVRPGPVETSFESTAMSMIKDLREGSLRETKTEEYYGKDMDHGPKSAAEFAKYNAPASKVAATIKGVLCARNPRNFVFDTWGTWFAMTMMSWTPLWLIDRFLAGLSFAKQ